MITALKVSEMKRRSNTMQSILIGFV